MPGVEALERIHVQPDERLRGRGRDLLDVDAALRREHEERLLRAPVERDREVVLARDLRGLLDPQLAHDVAADVQAEDLRRARLGLVGRLRELDATRLAAPAGQDLRLDDDGAAELVRRRARLLGGRRQPPVRNGDAEAPEELLPLVLVEVQSAGESTGRRRPECRSPACASMAR